MKFKITRSQFLEGLKTVQNVVPSKGALQIIQNILIEAKEKELFLTTTDLDISIRCCVSCEVENEGSTTLPARKRKKIVGRKVHTVSRVTLDAVPLWLYTQIITA